MSEGRALSACTCISSLTAGQRPAPKHPARDAQFLQSPAKGGAHLGSAAPRVAVRARAQAIQGRAPVRARRAQQAAQALQAAQRLRHL